jgi:hypothetical protein
MTAVDSRALIADIPAGGTFETQRAQARRLVICVLLIAVGALSAIQVIGFTSTMLTPFCLLLAPAVLLMRPTRGQLLPLVLALIGFVAFFISSQVNDLSIMDQRVLQWAAFAIYYVGFLVLAGKDVERCFSILCGIAIGTIIYFALPGGPYANLSSLADLWKYAWAQWATIILLYLLIQLRVSLPMQMLFLVALAGFSLVENYRSHAMVCLATAAVLVVGWLGATKLARWVQLLIVALFGAGVATLVPAIAMSGIAGEAIQRKTELQANSGVPALLAGRTESPLSLTAILDRPWFGWGTANNISPEVIERAKATAFGLGFRPDFPIEHTWYLDNGDVSLHSILLTAWAEGGLFAALLPLALFAGALMIIWSAPRYGRWAALAIVVAIQAVWDLLFSPTSYNTLPALAVLALVFAARHLPARKPALEGEIRGR